jgi:hypothetical protein
MAVCLLRGLGLWGRDVAHAARARRPEEARPSRITAPVSSPFPSPLEAVR